MLMTIAVLFIILLLILILKGRPAMCCDEEIVTTTTTTTEHAPELNIVGGLKRQLEGEQFFVIDPVDKKKIFVNSNDDMYEDADGKIWRLA